MERIKASDVAGLLDLFHEYQHGTRPAIVSTLGKSPRVR